MSPSGLRLENLHFFTLHPYNPHFFGVRRIRPNGILSPPYPEVTLDNFGFPVGGRLATRRAVFQPPGQNLTIDKWFFDRKSFFLKLSLKLIEVLWKAMVIVKLPHFGGLFVHFYKLIRLPPGPLCPPSLLPAPICQILPGIDFSL